ncbi:hypothetical protein [Microbacterium ulmi]|uniref:Uncharacterized protein n=1 Tax=Microbacterium ulmi TaxID=179095 RepID=A0A7Y2Q2W7_9MICO|nr:hypothetical protein [Microbacterium ulmi]NII70091.1 hypothetical protein [Microbacterium ulmi]NNH05098.1 hypothetical protein [Microbacterium ulmi]
MSAPAPQGVRPLVALGFATVAFIALLIFGLGMLSLLLDADVIGVPGLGQVPGVVGTVLATASFAAVLWAGLRRAGAGLRPSFLGALWCAVAAFLGYVLGVWLGAVFSGSDLAASAAAAGGVAAGWFGAVVAGAGFVAGWGGIALVRTRAGRPRWPWESDDDE